MELFASSWHRGHPFACSSTIATRDLCPCNTRVLPCAPAIHGMSLSSAGCVRALLCSSSCSSGFSLHSKCKTSPLEQISQPTAALSSSPAVVPHGGTCPPPPTTTRHSVSQHPALGTWPLLIPSRHMRQQQVLPPAPPCPAPGLHRHHVRRRAAFRCRVLAINTSSHETFTASSPLPHPSLIPPPLPFLPPSLIPPFSLQPSRCCSRFNVSGPWPRGCRSPSRQASA